MTIVQKKWLILTYPKDEKAWASSQIEHAEKD